MRSTGHLLGFSVGLCATLASVCLALSPVHGGVVVFVDDDAAPNGDGASWDSAFRFLQDALEFASDPRNSVNEVRVAQGLYQPDRSEAAPDGTGDREATFKLINDVTLAGGYAGLGAEDPDARDPEVYESLLGGDLVGDDGDDFEKNDENSFHVITASGADATAVLDGFVISGGNANGTGDPHLFAGGLFIDAGSPTIANCRIERNFGTFGGGMFNFNGSCPTVSDCTFVRNAAEIGGGVYNHTQSDATFLRCDFIENTAISQGGGMMNHFQSHLILSSCTFVGNSAMVDVGSSEGGALKNNNQSSATVTNCLFIGNAADTGAAIHNRLATLILTNCTSSGNTAGAGDSVYGDDGAVTTIVNCILWDESPIDHDPGEAPEARYSDVRGGWPGIGNIDVDPLFLDPRNDDHRLSSGSPCIDAGDTTAVPANTAIDLDGDARLDDDPMTVDTGPTGCPVVDMGAYEFQDGTDECCPADLDDDGIVGATDLLILLATWGCPDCPADLNCDATVDTADLLILLGDWG